MNRAELELEAEHLNLLDRLTAAKDRHRSKPTDETKLALADVKAELHGFRAKWRDIRTAFTPTADGEARPAAVKASGKTVS